MFARPTRSFISARAKEANIATGPSSIRNAIRTARVAEGAALEHRVRTFLKRNEKNSATNYTRRLKVGDFVLRKRTTFPSNSPRKLCFKIKIDGYEVLSRVATNAYKVKSVLTGQTETLAGDLCVKTTGYDAITLKKLVESMLIASERNTASIGRPTTRSRNLTVSQISRPLFCLGYNSENPSCDELGSSVLPL